MLRAFGQAVTRAVDFFIEANVDHVLQKRQLNGIPDGYRNFRKQFYHASTQEMIGGINDAFNLNKWVSVAELMNFTHVAAGGSTFVTPYDKEQHLTAFTKALKSAIQRDPDIAYKSEEINSLDGFYVRAVDLWNIILQADLPDGGMHNMVGSRHSAQEPNEEVPRPLFVDGIEHKEWLNFKHPMIYALAIANDCTRLLPKLQPYNPADDGYIKDQSNNPYMP